ncbi:MAG TPA: transposase [Ignavibacteriaceae bacterium]|nr:transposase [Ignavibacteriaceae bacterium]
MKSAIHTDMISLKELARLTDEFEFQKEYNAIRQRASRGKYSTYKKIDGEGFVSINDPLIPDAVKIKLTRSVTLSASEESGATNNQSPITSSELSQKQTDIALARVDLLKAYLDFAEKMKEEKGSLLDAKHRFIILYNNKAFPNLFEILDRTTFKTVERWKADYEKSGRDYRVLAPKYKTDRPSSVPPEQSEILIKLYLNPNKPLVSEVVRMAMDMFLMKNHKTILSDHTYRRFIERWVAEHYAHSVFYREGQHALDDKVLPFIERDYNRIEVGDIIVADGHTLNFEIINPFTGKPKRMTMVLFFDMKSNFPLGWEISPTENVLSIAVAFRRSVLRLGKYPKVVYLDNGRAFGAKYFNGVDFNEAGITGLFERIGTKVITAIPYHAQSKTVERFFKSFAEIERLLPTYTGTSIELQPPRLNRGEKLHTKLYEKMMHGTSLSLSQAHHAVAWWFDRYAERIQQDGHLKGERPQEIFESGKGPGVDKKELTYLMMSDKITTIYRNGIKILGTSFWNEALFGMRKEVVVRFDLIETDSIFVYDTQGKFICEALRVDKVHPAAGILGNEEDVKKLEEQLQKKADLRKSVESDARQFLTEEIYPTMQKQLDNYNIIRIDKVDEEKPQNTHKRKRSLIDRWSVPGENSKQKNIDLTPKAAEG